MAPRAQPLSRAQHVGAQIDIITLERALLIQRAAETSVVASAILKAVSAPKPKQRYHPGYMAGTSLVLVRVLKETTMMEIAAIIRVTLRAGSLFMQDVRVGRRESHRRPARCDSSVRRGRERLEVPALLRAVTRRSLEGGLPRPARRASGSRGRRS
jgi:hypothetical protein